MIINSPEVFLKSFNNRILNLLNSTEILENPKIKNDLKLIYRKLTISEILFEKYIISISGLQGVGKTTLLKQIYSIPDEFLPENIGRGEQLPVLITESDVSEITLYVTRLKEFNNKYLTVKEKIEKEEFFKISKGFSSSDLILEMKVPNKLFNCETKSFLLLPGFEDTKNEREDLVYHSLISSATCLFLFNETGFANQSNKNILEEINAKFERAKPIFIATFSDESKDENESLKKNLIETFNLQNEEDRVISIGTGKYKDTDTNRIDDWLPKLRQSLDKYSHTTSQFRKTQMENLNNIIDDELGIILAEIEEVKDSKDIKLDLEKLKHVKEPIELLDAQIRKIRKEYSKILDDNLAAFTEAPISKMCHYIIEEKNNIKFKKWIFGSSLKDIVKFENEIGNYWNTSNGYGVNELHTAVLNNLLLNEFKFHKQLELNPLSKKNKLLGDFSQPENMDCSVSQETVDDIRKLFHSDDNNDPKFSDKFNNSIKIIPLLSLEFIRIATISSNNIEFEHHDLSTNDKIEEVFRNTEFFQSNTNFILPGIAALLGIDAIDGKIDLVAALSSALGISSTTIATSLLAGAGVIGAGILVKNVITQINKAEIEDAAMAKTIIYGLKDSYYAHYISNFDDMMEDLRNFLVDKFNERYHIDKGVARREYLIKTIADVREDKYNLSHLLNKQVIL